jgi:hypothetical protein
VIKKRFYKKQNFRCIDSVVYCFLSIVIDTMNTPSQLRKTNKTKQSYNARKSQLYARGKYSRKRSANRVVDGLVAATAKN